MFSTFKSLKIIEQYYSAAPNRIIRISPGCCTQLKQIFEEFFDSTLDACNDFVKTIIYND
jgi:hypothetical protein